MFISELPSSDLLALIKILHLWTHCISESDVWLSPPITVPVKWGPRVQQGNQDSSTELSLFQMAELTCYVCFVKTRSIINLQVKFLFIYFTVWVERGTSEGLVVFAGMAAKECSSLCLVWVVQREHRRWKYIKWCKINLMMHWWLFWTLSPGMY